jgi:hypothetical protein
VIEEVQDNWWGHKTDWPACFGQGLSAAVASAIKVAAGVESHLGATTERLSPARKARNWFNPLIGALAAAFDIVEGPLCARG